MLKSCVLSIKLCRRHAQMLLQRMPGRQTALAFYSTHSIDKPKAVRLAYRVHEGTFVQKPVLILHGLLGNGRNWDGIAKQLARLTQKTVITVDSRNHGDSEHVDDMSFEAMSMDIINLLKELNEKSCTLIGHSLGGRIAMTLALMKPKVVDKLIPIDISPVHHKVNRSVSEVYGYVLAMDALPMDHGLNLYDARKQANTHLESAIPDVNIRGFILTNLVKENGKLGWRLNLDSIIKNFKVLGSVPDYGAVYEGPTLFIGGTKSDYIKPSHHPEILRLYPQAKIEMIQDAGHWVHYNKPKELLDILVPFIKS